MASDCGSSGRPATDQRPLAPPAAAAGLEIVGEFNLGDPDNYRVADEALHRPGPDELWNATAALVAEILSPGDETWEKLPFYAAHHVDELLIVDPDEPAIHWLALDRAQAEYRPIRHSALIDLGPDPLAGQLDCR